KSPMPDATSRQVSRVRLADDTRARCGNQPRAAISAPTCTAASCPRGAKGRPKSSPVGLSVEALAWRSRKSSRTADTPLGSTLDRFSVRWKYRNNPRSYLVQLRTKNRYPLFLEFTSGFMQLW